jgi:hypothetical protein
MKNLFLPLFFIITLNSFSQFNWLTEASYMTVNYENFASLTPNDYKIKNSTSNKGFGIKLKQNYIVRNDKNNFGLLTGLTFSYYKLENEISYNHNRGTTTPYHRPYNFGTMMSTISIFNANFGLEFYNTDKLFYIQVYTSPTIIGSFNDDYEITKGHYFTLPDTSYTSKESETYTKTNKTYLNLFPKIALQTGARINVSEIIKLNIGISFEYAIIREDNYFLNDFFRAYLGVLF